MGTYIIEGRGGGGKGLSAIKLINDAVARGWTISTNMEILRGGIARYCMDVYGVRVHAKQLLRFDFGKTNRFWEITPRGSGEGSRVQIFIDETQFTFNARDWASADRDFFKWLSVSRHDNVDVYFLTQNVNNIDKQIRGLVHRLFWVKNLEDFQIAGIGYPFAHFSMATIDADFKTQLDYTIIKKDKRLFGCYVSKQHSSAFAGIGVAPVVNVQSTIGKKRKRKAMIIRAFGIVGLLLLLGAGLYWYKRMNAPGGFAGEPAVRAPASVVASGIPAALLPSGVPDPVQLPEKLLGIVRRRGFPADKYLAVFRHAGLVGVGDEVGGGYVVHIDPSCVRVQSDRAGTVRTYRRNG
jgi:hypothetical protein